MDQDCKEASPGVPSADMTVLHPEYVTNEEGLRKSVLLPIAEWKKIREALEELDDIRAYDEAKEDETDSVPFPDD